MDRGVGPKDAENRANGLIRNMRRHFAGAEVTGYEHRVGRYGLPDRDDEHVVAAAEHAGIGKIVTENAKDFPADRLPRGTEIVSARAFAAQVVREDPRKALQALEQIAGRSGQRGPAKSVDDLIGQLEQRYKMTEAADLLRQARGSRDASASLAQPSAERGTSRAERGRGGPRTQRLRGDRAEQRGGHQDRGRGHEGPRTR